MASPVRSELSNADIAIKQTPSDCGALLSYLAIESLSPELANLISLSLSNLISRAELPTEDPGGSMHGLPLSPLTFGVPHPCLSPW